MNIVIEVIGIVATVLILFSMLFKTSSTIGDIRMRVLNLVGSAIFCVYGSLLPAISTAVLNGALVIVNGVHLILWLKNIKKKKPQLQKTKNLKLQKKNSIHQTNY